MINCLEYALRFWEKEPIYKIHYNSDHAINLPLNSKAEGFLPIEEYGLEYFQSSFKGLLSEHGEYLLEKYFHKYHKLPLY